MKIVVIGGSGLIGSKLVERLRGRGHEVVAASPSSGVNTVTGAGVADVLTGAQVVVDVANSPSFADDDVLAFFRASAGNLTSAAAAAGVGHLVVLSVVGADRLPDSGYLRAKVAQEELVTSSPVPYTILRATQFFEFLGAIANGGADGDTVRLTSAALQPVAADDVADALTDVALGEPVRGTVELAGPERRPMADFARDYLAATGDPRPVVVDDTAPYFGAVLDDHSITPGEHPRVGAIHFADWLAGAAVRA